MSFILVFAGGAGAGAGAEGWEVVVRPALLLQPLVGARCWGNKSSSQHCPPSSDAKSKYCGVLYLFVQHYCTVYYPEASRVRMHADGSAVSHSTCFSACPCLQILGWADLALLASSPLPPTWALEGGAAGGIVSHPCRSCVCWPMCMHHVCTTPAASMEQLFVVHTCESVTCLVPAMLCLCCRCASSPSSPDRGR
jgi:hypothetical protein